MSYKKLLGDVIGVLGVVYYSLWIEKAAALFFLILSMNSKYVCKTEIYQFKDTRSQCSGAISSQPVVFPLVRKKDVFK